MYISKEKQKEKDIMIKNINNLQDKQPLSIYQKIIDD